MSSAVTVACGEVQRGKGQASEEVAVPPLASDIRGQRWLEEGSVEMVNAWHLQEGQGWGVRSASNRGLGDEWCVWWCW